MLIKPRSLGPITEVKYNSKTTVYFGKSTEPIFTLTGTVQFPLNKGKIGITHGAPEFMKQFYTPDVAYKEGQLSLKTDIPFKVGDKGTFLIQFNNYWDYQGKKYASFKLLDFKQEHHMNFKYLEENTKLLNEVIN